jgi:membrane associated rhomboid family serine protease
LSKLKHLRRSFERFCLKHRKIGIPNLMLWIAIGSAIVYAMSLFNQTYFLYYFLDFDRAAILRGEVWRLFTYVFTYDAGHPILTVVSLFCFYSVGKSMENIWGTLRFNLYYLCGIVLTDTFCMIFGGYASILYLNMSLFLGFSTLYPEARFSLFFIIPVKAWIMALVDLAITIYQVIMLAIYAGFPYCLLPLVAILNYFLFFGSDVAYIFPMSWRRFFGKIFKKKSKTQTPPAKTIQFTPKPAKVDFHHKCTVCGRTDASNPELEFRYCSRCNGYHCYCEEHISNHTHID